MIKQYKITMFKEFLKFLKEYKIIALSLAFIMGTASTSLVQSLVNNIIMPFIDPLILNSSWQQATLNLGPISLKWGAFLAEFINFIILAFVVFIIAKKIIKIEKEKK